MNARQNANRKNAALSTGPKDTSKTHYNAQKHGLLSRGVTELDAELYGPTLKAFLAYCNPEGPIELMLVERLALLRVRLRRIEMMEAEYITAQLNPPITHLEKYVDIEFPTDKIVVDDPGLPARISAEAIEVLSGSLTRYETALENRFFKTLDRLERLVRARNGEFVPPPIAVDISVSGDTVVSISPEAAPE